MNVVGGSFFGWLQRIQPSAVFVKHTVEFFFVFGVFSVQLANVVANP